MCTPTRSLTVLLGPLLFVTACGSGSSGQTRTAQQLGQRMEAHMAPAIAAHRAAVQSLPDGARVTLLDPSLFPNTPDALDNRIIDPRANIVEGLLDPSLMRIQVADTSTLPEDQRDTRVRNVTEYFRVARLGPSLRPAEPPQAVPSGSTASVPAGLAVTIAVECPQPTASWNGYGTGAAAPDCN
jgi:hypothetical protein